MLDRICFIRESQRYPDNFKVRHALASDRLVFPHRDETMAADLVGAFGLRRGRSIKNLSRGQLSAVGVIIGLASRDRVTGVLSSIYIVTLITNLQSVAQFFAFTAGLSGPAAPSSAAPGCSSSCSRS